GAGLSWHAACWPGRRPIFSLLHASAPTIVFGDAHRLKARVRSGGGPGMPHLLLIDDDAALLPEQVRSVFPAPAHRVEIAGAGAGGAGRVRRDRPDVVLLDLPLPDQSGLDVYERIRAIDARIPVIFVTTAKRADAAIEAMKRGAFDYLYKPLDLGRLRRV